MWKTLFMVSCAVAALSGCNKDPVNPEPTTQAITGTEKPTDTPPGVASGANPNADSGVRDLGKANDSK